MRKTIFFTLASLVGLACAGAVAWAVLPSGYLPFGRDPERRTLTQVV